MKRSNKLIAIGVVAASLIGANFAPTIVGAEPIITLDSLYSMVQQQDKDIDVLQTQLATLQAVLEATPTPEPTVTPEPTPQGFTKYYSVFVVGTKLLEKDYEVHWSGTFRAQSEAEANKLLDQYMIDNPEAHYNEKFTFYIESEDDEVNYIAEQKRLANE